MKALLQRVLWLMGLLCVVNAHAAFDAFLKIEGIEGEATAPGHTNWIALLTITNTFTPSGPLGGGGASSSLCFTKYTDKSSPLLFMFCAQGTVLPSARLELLEVVPSQIRLFDIVLSNVLVSAVSTSGNNTNVADRPTESFCLNFTAIKWTYTSRRTNSRLPEELRSVATELATGVTSSATNPAAFAATGVRPNTGNVVLTWQAIAGRTYDIYACPTITGAFSLLTQRTASADGPMSYSAPALSAAMFYAVEERQ